MMRIRLWLVPLAGLSAALAAVPGHAQLDITPPGVAGRPAARPAAPRPAQATARAPRTAPLPLPRPPEAETAEADTASALASGPPQPVPPPAGQPALPAPGQPPQAAPPAADTTAGEAPSRIDEAFRAAEQARRQAPAIPERHPAVVNAPLPPSRASEGPAAAAPPPGRAEAPAVQADAALTARPQVTEAPFAEAPERRVEGRAFSEKRYPIGRDAYLAVIRRYAEERRVPIDLADAVAAVESAYDPHAVGMADEIGLMQMRPSIARQLGFEGTIQDLFEPETNIRLGIAYLAGAWERSGGNLCQALMKYRAGWDETQMSALSLEYCRRALVHLNAIGSPLARGASLPAQPPTELAGRRPASRFNWAEHENRIRQIEQRFGGQNFGIIAR